MTIPQPPHIDWFRVIVDLERAGWSHRRIGRASQMHRLSVLRLKNGATDEPKHTPARLLIALWCKVLGRTPETIPCELLGRDVRNLDRAPSDTRPTSTSPESKEHPHGHSPDERPDSGGLPRAECAG